MKGGFLFSEQGQTLGIVLNLNLKVSLKIDSTEKTGSMTSCSLFTLCFPSCFPIISVFHKVKKIMSQTYQNQRDIGNFMPSWPIYIYK